MDTKQQPEALRLAEMLTADEWPGSVTLVSYAQECVAELLRQHAENETVRAGYAAARLEIESLRERVPAAARDVNSRQEAQEPVAWESTTPGYIKYITQARYEKFSPAVRRWYKPYRCSGCAERGAGFDACDIATAAAAQGFRDGQSTTKQEE